MDFETKLRIILEENGLQWKYDFTSVLLGHITKFVEDTFMEIVGEDEDAKNAYSIGEHNAWVRNELRVELRASLQNILGIKI